MGYVYCSADWHGNLELGQQVLDYLQPDDTLYYLGDAIDRGEDGLRLLELLLADPRVKFIKGNHEKMMEDYLRSFLNGGNQGFALWMNNGGRPTLEDLLLKSSADQQAILTQLQHLPLEMTYESPAGHTVILSHAGFTPFALPHRSEDPLWNREHFWDWWSEFHDREDWTKEEENTYLVHGHTPVPAMWYTYGFKELQEWWKEDPHEHHRRDAVWTSYDKPIDWDVSVLKYCDDHKIDIDMYTIGTGRVALLDLDDFTTGYFDAPPKEWMK